MATSGIGKLWKPVVNVTDLDEGERFWSAVSGLSPGGRHGSSDGDVFASLEPDDASDGAPWMLLQLVEPGSAGRGGTHLDFRVDDVASAVSQVEAIGGTVVKTPAGYPSGAEPYLEWAVMQDPFGNDFCLVRWPLT